MHYSPQVDFKFWIENVEASCGKRGQVRIGNQPSFAVRLSVFKEVWTGSPVCSNQARTGGLPLIIASATLHSLKLPGTVIRSASWMVSDAPLSNHARTNNVVSVTKN
jgi:hypothetical protein